MSTVPRLPLQTGHGAARALLAAALFVAPGALLWPLFLFGLSGIPLPASGGAQVIIGVWILGGALSLVGVRRAQRAWLTRAGDVLLTADSLEFVGGTHGGFSLPLREIAATRAGRFAAVGMARLAMPVAVAIGLLSVARLPLADRRAVHLLAMHGSAIAPVAPGEPFCCRSCGAPLPAPGDRIVVACVYCAAANVLAVSLRKRVGSERSLQIDLTAALTERASRRRVAWVGAILGAALTLVAIAAMVSTR